MNNLGTYGTTNFLPTGITNARDCEYVTYSSVAGSSGHRLVYTNTSDPQGTYSAYGVNDEDDYLEVIVAGAHASSAIFQIEVSY